MINRSGFIAGIFFTLIAGLAMGAVSAFAALPAGAPPRAENRKAQPVSIKNLEDSIRHAVMKYEGGRPPYQRYRPGQSIEIADNLLRWQNSDGGWPKNIDWLKVLTRDDLKAMPPFKNSDPAGSSLDNKNTWAQIDYLARVRRQTHLRRYDRAITRAVDFLIENQHPSGGWRGSDVDAITFNDQVMVGVLRTLRQVSGDDHLYGFVSAKHRSAARKAYEKGIACILKCQIRVNGQLTVWAQQHDHETFLPVAGRHYEFPFPATLESVAIVRLLMEIEPPDRRAVQAIDAAVRWLDTVKIEGLRIREIPGEPIKFPYHWTNIDRIEFREPGAPPIWARFYDLKTKEPVFANREKQTVRRYRDLTRERRTGYQWYGYWPARLLGQEYPAWRMKINPATFK